MEEKNTSNHSGVGVEPFQGIILGIIATPGIIANVFALVLTFRILRHQKIVCNVLIFGLSLCDLVGIVFICTPTWICYAYGEWTGGTPLCYFQGYFTVFTSLSSGLIATCMALDRYLAVRAPFFHRQRISFRFAKKALGLIISVCALISLMPVFGFGSFKLNLTRTYCTLNWFASTSSDKTYAYFFAIVGFLMVFVVIFTNMHVLFLILKRKQSARNLKGLRSKFQKVNETKKTAAEKIQQQYQRMMVIISILFLICWTPFMVSNVNEYTTRISNFIF